MQILIDTNFLLIPEQYSVDIFAEFQRLCGPHTLSVFEETIVELDKIVATQKPKFRDAAKIGLQLIKKKKIEILAGNGTVDKLILAYAIDYTDVAVATQDKILKKALRSHGIPCIILRGKSHLEMQ